MTNAVARVIDDALRPYNLGRLNPLGLNSVAPALFAHGTEAQRSRYLGPIVRNEERWCQLLSEPGAGSDLASLATRAVRDGDTWVLDGQKVWTTWAHISEFAICLARTDPTVAKRSGLTYFIVDLNSSGVEVRPLRHMGGEVDFNEVFLDSVHVPDSQRIGAEGDGWRVAASSLAGERQMVSGSSSGGVDRIGGRGIDEFITRCRNRGPITDKLTRQKLVALYSQESVRHWTNQRLRADKTGPIDASGAASLGKVDQGSLNQLTQMHIVDSLGMDAVAWLEPERARMAEADRYAKGLPLEVRAMLRSRANTIEGGTSEINKNAIGERVLGLAREPDIWAQAPWQEIPR